MLLADRAFAFIVAEAPHFGAVDEPVRLKRCGEVAFMAAAFIDAGRGEGSPLLDACWSALGNGESLCVAAARWPHIATVYPPFWRHGRRNAALEETLRRCGSDSSNPTLRILVAGALTACELADPASVRDALATSFLAEDLVPAQRTRLDAYVAAHVVLYLAPAGLVPEEVAARIGSALPTWIDLAFATGEIDIAAELILCAHELSQCAPVSAWQALADLQEEDGMVPFYRAWSRRFTGVGRDRSNQDQSRARFSANYHSTLVTAAAAITCAHRCGKAW